MKICMLATTFPRSIEDSSGQWIFWQGRSLVELGAEVTIIAPHDGNTRLHETVDGLEIHRFHYWWPPSAQKLCYGAGIPTNVRRNRWVAMQLPTLEAGFLAAALRYGRNADLYSAHWSFAAMSAIAAAKLTRKPAVTTAYSAEYIPKALRPINRFIIGNSSGMVSISNYTHRLVEQIGTPRQHLVIGIGVNPEKIAPADFDAHGFRASLGIRDDEMFVFAIGRLVERKGYSILIEAVHRLIEKGRKVRLLLGGRGPLHDELQAQIDAAGIGDRARLLGFIEDSELRKYMKSADVLVMPSIVDQTGDTEGLGVPALEAMANGTAVVASEIGGIVDIVQHGKTGLLVSPGDSQALATSIECLMDDASLQASLITNGYDLVSDFYTWGKISNRTLEFYEKILSKFRSQRS